VQSETEFSLPGQTEAQFTHDREVLPAAAVGSLGSEHLVCNDALLLRCVEKNVLSFFAEIYQFSPKKVADSLFHFSAFSLVQFYFLSIISGQPKTNVERRPLGAERTIFKQTQ